MKAVVVRGPKSVAVGDWDDPQPGPQEVLVAVASCGVCGTDRHIVEGTYPAAYPNVLGHEIAGIVTAIGAGVDRVRVGDRVAVDPNISCHVCTPCRRGDVHLCESLSAIGVTRPGGMAPQVAVPQAQLYPVPAHLSLEDAAFAEPLSCVVHGLERVHLPPGASVAVLGAGPAGLLLVQLAKDLGASSVVVSEPSARRRDLAESLGADEGYTPEMMEHESHSEAYDLVCECSGNPDAVAAAMRLARRGADVLLFGVPARDARVTLPPYEIYRKELRLVGSNINPFTMEKAVALLASGRVRVEGIVTHPVELQDMPALLQHPPGAAEIKAALRFPPPAGSGA
jgi:L-iditol 2-dehydrogenase